jgi:ABC-type phosphate/phosphonate transport system ATPase subunit
MAGVAVSARRVSSAAGELLAGSWDRARVPHEEKAIMLHNIGLIFRAFLLSLVEKMFVIAALLRQRNGEKRARPQPVTLHA